MINIFAFKKIELNIINNKLSYVNLLLIMSSKLYFKITNEEECHHGFQYVDGLNILKEEFNNDPEASCVSGRLYFTEPKNIYKFLDYGVYLREIYLPTDNPEFKMIKDPEGDKYGANMIILGKRRDLRDPETWKCMISMGVDIYAKKYILKWACENEYSEIIKYLVENGTYNDCILILASENGYTELVKYLVDRVNIHVDDDKALRISSKKGYFKIVKNLIKSGANIHASNNEALILASEYGHLKVVKYLIENGADIHANDDYALR
uniref:Putative ankyrin repeat protein n=1 Tax=Moumouvirus sp. 'Monve' TaxID=1128131 RepID=H2ED08_9VIRU|nr:putative ankyrin repeat protein [Moumouvirus Monve]